MNKKILLLAGGILVIVLIIIFNNSATPKTVKYGETNNTQSISPNVSTENGKQIIEITAKGGYTPRSSVAKANLPTIIRVKTNNSFDCSISLRIPAINYFKNLESTGTTDIELPAQADGAKIKGVCSMGMYSFSIQFQG